MTRPWLTLQSLLFLALVLATSAVTLHRAEPIQLRLDGALLQGRLARDFEAQYDAAFPAHILGVNLWAALEYLLFREGRPGVVVGRDGWLYSDEELRVAQDSEAQLERNLALISAVRNQLARSNVRLLVAIVPAKARVYPEQLGARRPAKLQQDVYGRIHERLQAEGINAPELLPTLIEAKAERPSFLRTDTHWTPWGAQRAAQRLAAAAQSAVRLQTVPQRYRTIEGPAQPLRGDLLSFLPLEPWFRGLLPPVEQLAAAHTEALDLPRSAGLLDTAPAPAVALVGTSYSADARWNFAGALREALGAELANYARDGVGPFRPMLDYLGSADFRQAAPRLLIWELPERYFLQPSEAAAAAQALLSTPSPTEERSS